MKRSKVFLNNSKRRLFIPLFVIIVMILVAGFGIRVRDLGRADFWTDEAVTVYHVQTDTLPALIESLASSEGVPPAYFLALSAWGEFGQSEFWLRIFSVWCGAMGVALMFVVARRAYDIQCGLIAGSPLAFSALHVQLSQWPRPYAFALEIALGLLPITLSLARSPAPWKWAAWILVSALTLYSLHMAGVVIVGTAAYLSFSRWRRSGWQAAAAPVGAGIGHYEEYVLVQKGPLGVNVPFGISGNGLENEILSSWSRTPAGRSPGNKASSWVGWMRPLWGQMSIVTDE